MGVYLSTPITDKVSSDESCKNYSYGASSMQGWRMTQEDAHNCTPDFDSETGTSLFAVYDGHGGAEVAKYCSQKLPNYIKGHSLYKEGKLEAALKEAFLGFDDLLTKEEIIKELKAIAGMDDEEEEDEEADPMCRSEADILRAEADMPIEDLMARYDGGIPVSQVQKLKTKDEKFLSPIIHGKRPSFQQEDQNTNNSAAGLTTDSIVARLEDKLVSNGHADNENNLNAEKELRDAESTSGSDTVKSEPFNGSVAQSMDCETDKCGNSIPDSSSTPQTVSCDTDGQQASLGKDSDRKSGVMEADSTSDGSRSHNGDSSSSPSVSVPSSSVTVPKSERADREVSEAQSSSIVSNTPSSGSSEQGTAGTSSAVSASTGSSASQSDAPSSSTSSVTTACSDVTPGPSGSGASSSSATAAGSSSDAGPSSSSAPAPSGSGLSKVSGTIQDEDFESDDSSEEEDDEYIEDSGEEEEEEEEEDLDDEEEEEQMMPLSDDQSATEEPGSDSGCTAVVALLKKDRLIVANAGDSRCVLCRAGNAVEMSFDHKPEDEPERTRIEAAGGKVTADGRVNGGLNLSRAIGDHCYKQNTALPAKDQMISAMPDIEVQSIGEEDEFMVLACDGIWNFMTSQEVVDFVREKLQEPEKRNKLSKICEEMFDHCLAPNTLGDGTGCDNMTCMIILLNTSPKNKRNSSDADLMEAEVKQPEKRVKIETAAEETKGEGDVATT